MWHPLRLAEDYAMADILTGGRVIFGVARGYHTREVETLRLAADRPGRQPRAVRGRRRHHLQGLQRGALLAQGQVLHAAAGGALSRLHAEGDHAWCRGRSACRSNAGSRSRAARSAPSTSWPSTASRGVIGGGSAEGGAVDRHMTEFQAAYAAPRHRARARASAWRSASSSTSPKAARRRSREAANVLRGEHEDVRRAAPGARASPTSRSRRCAIPGSSPNTKLPRIEDAVKAGGFLAGTPADIIEQLKAVEKRYPGLERVICTMPLGTHLARHALEQLDRFAKEVMPAFQPATAPPPRPNRRRGHDDLRNAHLSSEARHAPCRPRQAFGDARSPARAKLSPHRRLLAHRGGHAQPDHPYLALQGRERARPDPRRGGRRSGVWPPKIADFVLDMESKILHPAPVLAQPSSRASTAASTSSAPTPTGRAPSPR